MKGCVSTTGTFPMDWEPLEELNCIDKGLYFTSKKSLLFKNLVKVTQTQ